MSTITRARTAIQPIGTHTIHGSHHDIRLAHHHQTQPLLEIYGGRGITVSVNGMGGIEEITDRVIAALEISPPQPTA